MNHENMSREEKIAERDALKAEIGQIVERMGKVAAALADEERTLAKNTQGAADSAQLARLAGQTALDLQRCAQILPDLVALTVATVTFRAVPRVGP